MTANDNLGNKLSDNQVTYFKDSKIVDSQGNLLVCQHGTFNNDFTEFDLGYTVNSHKGGIGFYFSNKVDSEYDPNDFGRVIDCYLNITNPITDTEKKIPDEKWLEFVKSVDFRDFTNYADVDMLVGGADNDLQQYQAISRIANNYNINMKEFVDKAYEILGVDGAVWNNCFIAFFPNQIKSIDNLNPTNSNDINK